MTPREQVFPHDPDNGVYGDCFRAVIASLLNCETDQVPHFMFDNPDVDTYNMRLHQFLDTLDLFYLEILSNAWEFEEWKKNSHIEGDIYHVISGESPRFPGVGHSVVGCNGKVVHDPHPDKTGLLSIESYGMLVRKNG